MEKMIQELKKIAKELRAGREKVTRLFFILDFGW